MDWDVVGGSGSHPPKASFLYREWGVGDAGAVEEIPVSLPFEISCAFSPGNYCIGNFEDDNISVCNKPLQDGYEQCSACSSLDSSRICTICRGECDMPDPRCSIPHVVYLAAYSSQDVKVGVSTPERFHKRIVEHGALLAVVIANASNGKVARLLESRIQSTCNIPDKVNLKTRQSSFRPNQSVDSLKDALIEGRSRALSLPAPEGISHVDNGEFYDLLTNYNSSIMRFGDFYPQKISLRDLPVLEGVVVYVKGSDLLLKIGNSFYVLPFKHAIGKVLSPMQTKEVRRQTTFSDYVQQQEA